MGGGMKRITVLFVQVRTIKKLNNIAGDQTLSTGPWPQALECGGTTRHGIREYHQSTQRPRKNTAHL